MISTILIIVVCVCILGCTSYTIISNTRKNEAMLTMQIEASKVKGNDHVTRMTYDQLKSILNDLIGFYVTEVILLWGLNHKGREELSIMLDDVLTKVCSDVRLAMSESLVEGFRSYVTDKYIMDLIKDTSRIVLVSKLGIKQ